MVVNKATRITKAKSQKDHQIKGVEDYQNKD